MGWAVGLSIDDLAVRRENQSSIAYVKGQNASMEWERSVLELMYGAKMIYIYILKQEG